MTIFLVGGGTGGPTAPLLAVAEEILTQNPKTRLFFIGTGKGIEKNLVEKTPLPVQMLFIPAGKWRRYFSLLNFIDLFKIFAGFLKSLYLIKKHRPDLVFGAGSFVQVPAAYAAYLMNVPVVIHQQDLEILLSTRLVAPIASAITVSFPGNTKDFSQSSGMFRDKHKSKIFYTGNPVRKSILKGTPATGKKIFNLNSDYPAVLVLGGGTGSADLNNVIAESLPELIKYVQIIHVTGGKIADFETEQPHPHYHSYDFLTDNLAHAYAVADLVVSRAGLSTISELSWLGKPAILVPLPDSPQIVNAHLAAAAGAAVAVPQKSLTPALLVKLIRKLLWDKQTVDMMRGNIGKLMPKDAAEKVVKIICQVVKVR